MKNTRTLISSSIVSFIIVTLGMFMLCMSRAPEINYDEPLIEGGGVEFDSVDVNDEDFLKLLNEANAEGSLTEDDQQLGANNEDVGNDDLFSDILNEDIGESNSFDQSSESGDEGMEEILRLLELGDDGSSSSNAFSNQDDGMQELAATEFGESSGQSEQANISASPANDLSEEISRLEGVLSNRSSQIESLQVAINEYDQEIADFDSEFNSPYATTPVQKTSYYETSPSEESESGDFEAQTTTFSSDDFELNYDGVLELCHNHQFQLAIDGFSALLQQNPRHHLADNCQYWIGECYYAQGKYFQAVAEFNKIFAFESPDKKDDAQLMLGLAFMRIGEANIARSELDWLVSCYDASEYLNKANYYLERL